MKANIMMRMRIVRERRRIANQSGGSLDSSGATCGPRSTSISARPASAPCTINDTRSSPPCIYVYANKCNLNRSDLDYSCISLLLRIIWEFYVRGYSKFSIIGWMICSALWVRNEYALHRLVPPLILNNLRMNFVEKRPFPHSILFNFQL